MYVINKYAERVRIRLRSMVDLFFKNLIVISLLRYSLQRLSLNFHFRPRIRSINMIAKISYCKRKKKKTKCRNTWIKTRSIGKFLFTAFQKLRTSTEIIANKYALIYEILSSRLICWRNIVFSFCT